jgi:DnaJ-class molecular chaperone
VDYYKVLGLKETASEADIKNMYYKLCYEYHPDRTGGM